MRKISIVQRRLETGLDLTQAELRALQREARCQLDQVEDAESTVTAVEDTFDFLPPIRPSQAKPGASPLEAAEPWQAADVAETGSPGQYDSVESDVIDEVERSTAGGDRGIEDSREETLEGLDVRTEFSSSADELRAAVNELFSRDDFSFDLELDPETADGTGAVTSDEGLDSEPDKWESERDVLFPGLEPPEDPATETVYDTVGKSPRGSNLPVAKSTAKEDTLVLFLLQVPERIALAATFSASEDAESPFAGQLRLCSEADDSMALPGEWSEFDVNLPPEGVVRLSTGRVGNNGHGWALISLDEQAQAYATFDLRGGRNITATAAVFSKSPSRSASVPLRTGQSEDRALVLANPTERPVVVKLTLFNELGRRVSSVTSEELDPLPPGKQVAVFAKSIFQNLTEIASFRGKMVAEVVGEGLIWTAGLSQSNGILSFLPVNGSQDRVQS